MDVEKKHTSKSKEYKKQKMKKFLKKIIWISFVSFYFFQIGKVQAIVPYYYFPTIKNLQKQSLYIGKNAYQLLYFGQYEEVLT